MRPAAYPSEGGQRDIWPPSHAECNGPICAADHTSEVIGSQPRRSTVPSPPRSGMSQKHPAKRNSRRRGTLAGWLSARSTIRRGDEHKTRPMVPPRALSSREKSYPQEFSSVIYSGQGMNVKDTCSPSSLEVRHAEDFEEDCAPALAAKPSEEGRPMSLSQEEVFHGDGYSFRQRAGRLKKWNESKSAVSDPPRRQVTFFTANNMDLRINSDPADLDPMADSLLASPCVGTIQLSSPRYIAFQRFRKFMASQGIDAQVRLVKLDDVPDGKYIFHVAISQALPSENASVPSWNMRRAEERGAEERGGHLLVVVAEQFHLFRFQGYKMRAKEQPLRGGVNASRLEAQCDLRCHLRYILYVAAVCSCAVLPNADSLLRMGAQNPCTTQHSYVRDRPQEGLCHLVEVPEVRLGEKRCRRESRV